MNRIGLTIVVLGLAMATTSCAIFQKKKINQKSSVSNKNEARNINGRWELTYIVGGDIDKMYPTQIPFIVINTQTNQISGFNGCNTFSGEIQIEGQHISYPRPFTQTLIACEGKGEQVFLDALDRSKTFAFADDNTINFIGGDIGMMAFKRVIKK